MTTTNYNPEREPHFGSNFAAYNTAYPKGGVSCSKDRFVINQTLVFQIKFCGKSPALRIAANRQVVKKQKCNR